MSRFVPITEVVKDLCLRTGDLQQRKKGLYLNCAKDTFNDLNEGSMRMAERVRMPVRQIYTVNKGTNSINLPVDFLRLCSVNAIDCYGNYIPIFRNEKVSDDIVDIPSTAQNCACANGCAGQLCNTIQGYEAVISVKSDFLPNGTPISFNAVDRVYSDNLGFVYSQTQTPTRQYVSSVWVDTTLVTTNTKMCQLEVNSNGCICDTQANVTTLCNCWNNGCTPETCNPVGGNPVYPTSLSQTPIPVGGTASTPPCNLPSASIWQYYVSSQMQWLMVQCGSYPNGVNGCFANYYNISELGDRLIFPCNFGFDKVMVRFYADFNLKDLQIPYIAKETFMTGLQYFAATNNMSMIQQAAILGRKYSAQKWGLFTELNKYRIQEWRMIMTPPVWIPSYVKNRTGWGTNFGNFW